MIFIINSISTSTLMIIFIFLTVKIMDLNPLIHNISIIKTIPQNLFPP